MKNYLLTLIVIVVCTAQIKAQNGKIIEQKLYMLPDSVVQSIKKSVPNAEEIVANVNFYKIVYLSDGLKVKGYMSEPKKSGKYPCVIVNRGGNRDFGIWNDRTIMIFFGVVANWGYVVVGSQYRGNDGGEGKEEFGGSDVNDVLNLIPLLSNVEKADTSRMGMYGWSRGGMMTYLALAKTNKMKAAIIGSGMADAFIQTSKRPEMDTVFADLVPGYKLNRDSVLKTRSAVYWTDKICKTTPLLLLTGSADWRVSPDEQLEMVSKLYEIKHPFRYALFEGGDHGLSDFRDEVNYNARAFLDTYVRDGRSWPSMEPHGK